MQLYNRLYFGRNTIIYVFSWNQNYQKAFYLINMPVHEFNKSILMETTRMCVLFQSTRGKH